MTTVEGQELRTQAQREILEMSVALAKVALVAAGVKQAAAANAGDEAVVRSPPSQAPEVLEQRTDSIVLN